MSHPAARDGVVAAVCARVGLFDERRPELLTGGLGEGRLQTLCQTLGARSALSTTVFAALHDEFFFSP